MPKIVCKKWKESYAYRFEAAEELRIYDKLCDVTMQSVDKVNVKAHKIILVTGSGYFNDLFFSGMNESYDKCIDYSLINLKGDVLEKVISFIYTGEMDIGTPEKIEEIAVCANYFQLNELIDECMKLLNTFLNDNNCLKCWRLAHECFNQEFEDQCISHVLSSPSRIYENESFFNELDKDELTILIKDARIPWSEEMKFEKLLQWTKENTNTNEEFKETFSKFIELINFTSFGRHFYGNILDDDHLTDHKDILKIIASKCKEGQHSLPSSIDPEKKLLAFIDSELITISDDRIFSTLEQNPNRLKWIADTTFKNFLFICGGRKVGTDGELFNTCKYFDPVKKEWNVLPSMPTSRAEQACTFLDDKIYVCGGYSGSRLSIVEIFDVNQQKWTQGENMKTGRNGFGLTSANRALYAVGGFVAKTIEMFDPRSSNEWAEVYSGFTDDKYTRCISIDSDIYCFQKGENLIFDTKMNKMRYSQKLPKPPHEFKLCFSHGNFNCIQQSSDDGKCLDLSKFNLEQNEFYLKKKALQFDKFCYINAFVALNF